ncbi:MAG: FAD-dependent monooxygenase [Anaerolineae bacterium]
MKAVIIGAGVGGLCTAIALQGIGVDVSVYEQAEKARADGAGLVLWANAVRALRQLGLEAAISNSYAGLEGTIRRWDGLVLSRTDAAQWAQIYGAPSIGVHREDLMQVLLPKIQHEVHFGKQFAAYEPQGSGIGVTFADGTHISADLLIGADGLRSRVRQQMQPGTLPVYRGYAAWRGVIPFAHDEVKGMWGESWGRGARFGIVPLVRDRVYWFATANRPANSPPPDHKAALRSLFGGWHAPISHLIEATPEDRVLYNDIADLPSLSRWVDGRVTLLGDAAHAMTPNMGQGACQAIEDALALREVLRQWADIRQALAVYQATRLAHTRKVVERSRMIGRIGQISHPVLTTLRDHIMRLTPARLTQQQFDFVLR